MGNKDKQSQNKEHRSSGFDSIFLIWFIGMFFGAIIILSDKLWMDLSFVVLSAVIYSILRSVFKL